MAYYIRVLSPDTNPVSALAIRTAFSANELPALLSGDDEGAAWQQLSVAHPDGRPVCLIERNAVTETGLGREEIDEFEEEVRNCLPKSAALWLGSYLPSVQTIYAIQILQGACDSGGWDIVDTIKNVIWNASGGIIQADSEGFSNEDGYHILWQFSDDATGDWWMAVPTTEGGWLKFRMDVGNPAHRAACLKGEIPPGVEIVDQV